MIRKSGNRFSEKIMPKHKITLESDSTQLNQTPAASSPTESEASMSERLETLKKARERMTDDRDAFAKTLAAPFDRDKAERARLKFIETQALIDAIDRAIAGEPAGPAA
jgi:hypothetical protein